ncbi:MAG: cell division protein FtsZ [Deltaproteobacteria bacterium]|nr:cell division protein FtsZ [Deltaproteobacteria bacterium]MBN2672707.1 cell division protein FtsZ [Deltaproteobacteria bacterium]
MHFELDGMDQHAKIKVVGVGGGGGNAVANMIAEQIDGVEFVVVNTDHQALEANPATTKIQIGTNLTKGLGAGGHPDVGRKAALEDVAALEETLRGSDMVFIAAGMGGGTGTGAASIVAQVAKEVDALTVGVVTKPFRFEGRRRMRFAEEGIHALGEEVDTQIVIPNESLLSLEQNLAINDAFNFADQVLCNAVRGISDLITIRGQINVDFADVRTIMTNRGRALMGTGYGTGANRAIDAAEMAINSPLLEDVKINGATGILINITGGPDMTMNEVADAVAMIEEAADEDAHIIFGYVTLEEPCDEVKCTVIATGFQQGESMMVQQNNAIRTSYIPKTSYKDMCGNQGSRSSVPAVSHRESVESVSQTGARPVVTRASVTSDSHLDIPAFIRKQHQQD